VLDMEESPMPLPLPIILGRPFMRTADTKIYVKKGTVSMKVNGEKIEFKVFDALKLPLDNLDCFNICLIQNVVEKVLRYIIVIQWKPLSLTVSQGKTLSQIVRMLMMISLKPFSSLKPLHLI